MIHVAIVDDLEEERENLKQALDYVSSQRGVDFCIDEYPSAEAFFFSFKCQFDLIFLDIEMPGEDGISAAHRLRAIDSNVLLIFETKMAQFVLKGYEVDALDFLIKPIQKEEFLLKMSRPLNRLNRNKNSSILININGDMRSIRCESIYYISVNDHYVTYHTNEGDLDEYISLGSALKKVSQEKFIYASRQAIVNLRYVEAIKGSECHLKNDIKIEISRSQKKNFVKSFAVFLGGVA